jgi:hypothetical protein
VKIYEPPLLPRLALWVALHAIPDRVYAAIMIMTYDSLEDHYRAVNHHNEDGSRELFDAVSAVRVEKLRRNLWRNQLKAAVEEK